MKQKILTVLAILLALVLMNAGLNKFFNYMPVSENLPEAMANDFMAMAEISWLMPLIAVIEILSGLLLILPKTRALGAIVIFPVMVGILLTHLFVDTSGLPLALVFWFILIWILYENRAKYRPLIG